MGIVVACVSEQRHQILQWFHSGGLKAPRPLVVRLAGAFVLLLVVMLAVFAKK